MASPPTGARRDSVDVSVAYVGERRALAAPTVRRVVTAVVAAERARVRTFSVTFLSAGRMRGLNRRTLHADRATDVISFPLSHADGVVGDVYVCPAVARRTASRLGIPAREELVRLVVHGTLHALGYDHPPGDDRVASAMWRRQERYVDRLCGTSR